MLYDDFAPTKTIWVSTSGRSSNSGSEGSPLNSINAALKLATPGTAIMVKAGTYREDISITKSGTDGAPIALISADGAHAAKIAPTDASARPIRGFGVENIIVDGFEIVGNNRDGITFTQAGSNFSDLAKNIVIKNNYVHDTAGDGIKIAQADNVYTLNNLITRTKGQGIDYVAVQGGVIAFNDVSATPSNSLVMAKGGSARIEIHDNVIHDSNHNKTINGILIGGSTENEFFRPGYDKHEAYDVVAYNNTIYNVERGIQFMGAKDSTAHHNHLYNISGHNVDLAASTVWHTMNTVNATVHSNGVSKSAWLDVDSGQGVGLKNYDNVVGKPPSYSSNKAPVAQDDAVTTSEAAALKGNVLDDNGTGKDSDPDGDALSVTAVNGVGTSVGKAVTLKGGGQVVINADGTFAFDPKGAYAALKTGEKVVETVSYQVSDGKGGTATATLTITVNGVSDVAKPTGMVIEAEAFTGLSASAFVAENNAAASGGKVARLPSGTNEGEMSTVLPDTVKAGVYDIVVRYFDEADGIASTSLRIGSEIVDNWTWDGTFGGANPSAAALTTHTISGVTLSGGETLTLSGLRNVGEWVRVDSVELVAVKLTEEPVEEPAAGLLIEAEAFTGLAGSTFAVESNAAASGGSVIRLPSGTNEGEVSTVLPDSVKAGVYDIVVRYFDETDGLASTSLRVGSETVDSWTWDSTSGTEMPSAGSLTSHTISGVSLTGGETLTLSGMREMGEWVRVDSVELVPVAIVEEPTTLRIEAEDFSGLSAAGFVVESNADASGGSVIRLPSGTNQGEVSTIVPDSVKAGTYDVVVHYFDETDGSASTSLRVGEQVADSWIWDGTSGTEMPAAGSLTSHTISGVSLSGGETLTLEGLRDIGEWVRVDAIDLVSVASDDIWV
ncbi:MAG: right-handed parallel beta-helix repeat-containing protein [Rhodospirillaceae bacterium]